MRRLRGWWARLWRRGVTPRLIGVCGPDAVGTADQTAAEVMIAVLQGWAQAPAGAALALPCGSRVLCVSEDFNRILWTTDTNNGGQE